ncbi:MAG: DUF2304 domain-containing protein [Coriobacteriia bacterium]|nr:DUF2304 domain-containing protein [Coriobacteriia bacterium]
MSIVIYFVVIFNLLKRNRLNLKYTLLWLGCGVAMILVVAFPGEFASIIHFFGIIELTNGIFALGLFALLMICMALTSIVSTLNAKIRSLIQTCALYEKRIRELEEKVDK